ncbi:SKI family transcriptional corepressor 1 homolog-B [Periplaneta americana]|uniref:SKI family transcriptional corepressor 1 homolog-B n=1 Tax=Periplaneta americana TaxID=6978 RepID=UPI0037E99A8E
MMEIIAAPAMWLEYNFMDHKRFVSPEDIAAESAGTACFVYYSLSERCFSGMESATGIPITSASHVTEPRSPKEQKLSPTQPQLNSKPNQVGTVLLYGIPIVSLVIESQERLCLAQISNTLLKEYSYNEIHNRRVALGITCVQCTPVQLEILRRAGAMPVSSRRCGMITRREAERLCKSFLGDNSPPRLPEDFAFSVHHECAWGCRGAFLPARYNSSRAKCIKCTFCGLFFSPNKFIFHSHRTGPTAKYVQPDAANFNSWRRHMKLSGSPPEEVITHAWEDVKAMFNGGTRKRLLASAVHSQSHPPSAPTPAKQPKLPQEPTQAAVPSIVPFSTTPASLPAPPPRVPPFPDLPLPLSRSLVMDYVWHHSTSTIKHHQFPFPPYAALPWLAKRGAPFLGFGPAPHPDGGALHSAVGPQPGDNKLYQSAFRPVYPVLPRPAEPEPEQQPEYELEACSDEETVDIETTEEDAPVTPDTPAACWTKEQERSNESNAGEETAATSEEKQELQETQPSPQEGSRLWTVARLSDRALYRQEMARQLHIMRELAAPSGTEPCSYFSLAEPLQGVDRRHGRLKEAQTALQQLSSKMALDCSTCHQLYSSSVISPDTKLTP